MKNVIVFAVSGGRYAMELRWVREVITLGHLTPVPRGPAGIAGVVNFGGAILPVLDLGALAPEAGIDPPSAAARAPRPGDSAVLFEVEGTRAALAVDTVLTVMTVADADGDAGHTDHRGRPLTLLEPPALVRAALAAAQAAAAELAGAIAESSG